MFHVCFIYFFIISQTILSVILNSLSFISFTFFSILCNLKLLNFLHNNIIHKLKFDFSCVFPEWLKKKKSAYGREQVYY